MCPSVSQLDFNLLATNLNKYLLIFVINPRRRNDTNMQFRFKTIFRYEFFGTLIFHSPAMKKKTQMTKTIYVRPYVSYTIIRPSVHPFDPTTVDRRLTKALHRLILKLTNKIKFHFLFRFDSEGVCMHAMFDVVCFCFQHTKNLC